MLQVLTFQSYGLKHKMQENIDSRITHMHVHLIWMLIVSPDKSRGYLGFSTVTPPPQSFPFGRDNLKNILVTTFKYCR